jgi:predicted permease
MRIPVLRGRGFTAQDAAEGEQVVVIDRVLADRYWPGQDPIGQFVHRGDQTPDNLRRIIGVVATVKHHGLDDATTKETIYFPFTQRPVESFTLVVRTALPPHELIDDVRQAVLTLDAEQPLFDIQTMAGRIDGRLQRQRTPMLLIGLFSDMALLLAALGVYGALAFSVGQRTQEFGIRAALGATARNVLGLVLRQGLLLVGLGVGLGLVGYLVAGRFLRSLVFEITPLDPVSLLAGPAVLIIVALAACLLPARRATKVDPVVALRAE